MELSRRLHSVYDQFELGLGQGKKRSHDDITCQNTPAEVDVRITLLKLNIPVHYYSTTIYKRDTGFWSR
jgi:hypothetical protein